MQSRNTDDCTCPLKCKDRKVQINKLSLTSAHTALALTVQRIVRVMAPFLYSTYEFP